jgi:hypothetical protein
MMNAQQVAMIVHAGGIKGDTESCGDTLLNARLQVLDDSPTPLLYVPGETDWAECQKPSNGKFDAVERLNRLQELFFPLDTTLGRRTLPVVRQSDQALFRSYRENVRLVTGGVMLVGLNLPGDNNHYRIEGGRNGEFEDRREANRQWLARAFSLPSSAICPASWSSRTPIRYSGTAGKNVANQACWTRSCVTGTRRLSRVQASAS